MGEQNNEAKVSEEDLYAAALVEVQSGTTRPGLWAKAFADAEGDESKSKALYIKLRVQQEIERKQQEQKIPQRQIDVAPELRDSFSSKSAERADEKSGRPGEGAVTVLTNFEKIMYFFLVGFAFVFLFFILASRGLAGIAAENLAIAAGALGDRLVS